MDAALIITWKAPHPGHERKALEFAAESEEFWGKQAADGRCTAPEWFFFNGTGMWMVKGERRVLDELLRSDESRRLIAKGTVLVQDWQYVIAETGSGAQRYMAEYSAAAAEVAGA